MIINNKTILITGGTGSFGKKLIEVLLKKHNPHKIIIFSRDELKQYEMQQTWPVTAEKPLMRYFIGDVRDLDRLKLAMRGVDIVVHAAALKQVPTAEYNPFEAVKTNIIGGQNVIDAAMYNKVKAVLAMSTDKAAAPTNLYGATKLASDKLFIAANAYRGSNDIKLSVVRYGNVMGSRGSVIPFFLKERHNGILPITDKRMTRFNITLDQGVNFVLECIDRMWGGELFIPKIPSYNIIDVVKAISSNIKYDIIGIRPGEKLHEEMITKTDAINTIEFQDYFVILPSTKIWDFDQFRIESSSVEGNYCSGEFSYNSKDNDHFLTVDELKVLIEDLDTE